MKWHDIALGVGLTLGRRLAAPVLGALIALMADVGLLDGGLTDALAAVLYDW